MILALMLLHERVVGGVSSKAAGGGVCDACSRCGGALSIGPVLSADGWRKRVVYSSPFLVIVPGR
jgi:hypothetical protein